MEEGRFLRELLQRLRGSVVEVPPLCARPEDMPLLIYYYVQRYHRGDYRDPTREVKEVDPMFLYFTAGRRWDGNLDELERWVIDACRAGAGLDEKLCLEPRQTASWPEECPFVLSLPDFVRAREQSELLDEIAVEDLPAYDLKGLLVAVDADAPPTNRGRWTLEARRAFLGGRHPDTPVVGPTAEPVPAVGAGQGVQAQDKPSAPTPELRIDRDEHGHLTFMLGDRTHEPKLLKGFQYLLVLYDNPEREYSPSELRDCVTPDRKTANPETDRGSVRRAFDVARKSLPGHFQTYVFKHFIVGTTCVFNSSLIDIR